MSKLKHLEPAKLFYYFEEITKIPRCSMHEEQIADYLCKFAKDRNLEHYRDSANNVIIVKKPSPGYEDVEPIILQGHMDMVCEKIFESKHDFSKDPIDFIVDRDLIIAKETTLGADNGVAVAMMLALLDEENLQNPRLECLFTTNEESGMTGARNLDSSPLTAKRLINLDSEEEGVATVACAGGQRSLLIYKIEREEFKDKRDFYELSISGLKGGHSGTSIDKGYANAIVRLARALYRLNEKFDIKLISINGGVKENAIPRRASAKLAIKPEDLNEVRLLIIRLNAEYVKELGKIDPDVRLNFEASQEEKYHYKDELKDKVISVLNVIPNGVLTFSKDIPGLVESSSNLGVIREEDDELTIISTLRSSRGSLKEFLSDKNKILAEAFGAEYKVVSNYPEWQYEDHSEVRDLVADSYLKLFNKNIEFYAIHGGLECAIFKETIGSIDMVSIGPSMSGIHAPGESLSISSTKRVYELLKEVLKNTKDK